jgi:hypothetical protein
MAVFGMVRALNRLAGHYGGRQEGER